MAKDSRKERGEQQERIKKKYGAGSPEHKAAIERTKASVKKTSTKKSTKRLRVEILKTLLPIQQRDVALLLINQRFLLLKRAVRRFSMELIFQLQDILPLRLEITMPD